jgi:hypothetical protein
MTAGTDFGAPPPPNASASQYIGVPSNYAYLPHQNRSGFNIFGALGMPSLGDQSGVVSGAPVLPRYMSGNEFDIASFPPEQLARLQQQLATAGLIGPSTKVHVGVADDATINAFKSLLGFANVNGLEWPTALAKLVQNPPQTGSSAASGIGGGGGNVIQQENPANEDDALRSAAQQLLGKDPSPEQLQGFRPYYDALTRSAQQQGNTIGNTSDLQDADGGQTPPQTVVNPPSLSDAAESYLRQNAGIQVQGENLSHVMNALDGLISGAGEADFGQKGNG